MSRHAHDTTKHDTVTVRKSLPTAVVWLHCDADPYIGMLRLVGGCPLSWHQQRTDALVRTPAGLIYYGTISSPAQSVQQLRLGAIGSHSMINLNALGSRPLGLSSYGNLVCTLSNPSVIFDMSVPGHDVILPLLDVADVSMMNAMRIVHMDAVRQAFSAPLNHLLFMFCTNEGVLAAKAFPHDALMRHLDSLRHHPMPTTVRSPESQLMVLHRSEEAINDFCVSVMHPDRNVLSVIVCYDGDQIDVGRIRFTSSGTSLNAVTMMLQRIRTGSSAQPHCPLSAMEKYFTYVASSGPFVVATADIDCTIAVFHGDLRKIVQSVDPQPVDGALQLKFLIRVREEGELPYKAVHVSGHCFLVACQRVLYCVEASTGSTVRLALPSCVAGSICGLVSNGDGVAYVAVTHVDAASRMEPDRFLRINVSMKPRATLHDVSSDMECFDRHGELCTPSAEMCLQLAEDPFSLRAQASDWLRGKDLSEDQRELFVAFGSHRCRQDHTMEECTGGTPKQTFTRAAAVDVGPMHCRSCNGDQQFTSYFWCSVCGEVLCTTCATTAP